MSSATTLSTPQDQVESLMKQIAEENDLDITEQLTDLNPTTASIREDKERKKEDDLSRRYVQKHKTLLSNFSLIKINPHSFKRNG